MCFFHFNANDGWLCTPTTQTWSNNEFPTVAHLSHLLVILLLALHALQPCDTMRYGCNAMIKGNVYAYPPVYGEETARTKKKRGIDWEWTRERVRKSDFIVNAYKIMSLNLFNIRSYKDWIIIALHKCRFHSFAVNSFSNCADIWLHWLRFGKL